VREKMVKKKRKAYTEVAEDAEITEKKTAPVRKHLADMGRSDAAPLPELGEGRREVFVDQEPGGAALFEDAGVADLDIDGFAVLGGFGETHGDRKPSDVAAAGNL
jgi:hypothetical protein